MAKELEKECKRYAIGVIHALASNKGRPGREFIVDTGVPFHLIGRSNLTSKEKAMIRAADDEITFQTADKPISSSQIVDIHVPDFAQTVPCYVLPTCQPVLSAGALVEEKYEFRWKRG